MAKDAVFFNSTSCEEDWTPESTQKEFFKTLENKEFEFYVSYISAMGDFATWKPTNMKGDFDLKTFEVRLKPKYKIDDLRRGMTVNILVKRSNQNAN